MKNEDFRNRSKAFALRVIRDVLQPAEVYGGPGLGKASPSLGNLCCCELSRGISIKVRCRTRVELGVVEQESDETLLGWNFLLIRYRS